MVASLLISLREGLEAALIVGILFSYLRKTKQMQYQRYAWAGILCAVIISVMVAVGIQWIGAKLEGRSEQIFEGVMMLCAVLVLTWMIFWMRTHARTLKGNLETELESVFTIARPGGLFAVAFFAVAREGIETALLLTATAFVTNGIDTVVGTLLGLFIAAIIGVLLYISAVRLNVRQFFAVTSVMLLLFAAGMFTNSIHEFQEASLLPTLQDHVWDIGYLLNEESFGGQVLKALLGYNSSPSLLEVLGYIGFWIFALVGIPWGMKRFAKRDAPPLSSVKAAS